ncbi:hypothetical protein EPN95_04590 [Patescibacteria group bacterium]|nr:MAG: hypothetical protein EPN95_04590 [Patescibacteria group bacterium]
MALTSAELKKSFTQIVDEILSTRPVDMTKSEIKDAVIAADTWLTANAASYNSALPIPFRTRANISEKAFLLAFVALRRAGR